MVQSPETKKRKVREKVARHRARQSDDKKAKIRSENALQQKGCRANWSSGRKAKERRSNTRNQNMRQEQLKSIMIEEEPIEAFGSLQAEGKAMKRVFF